MDLEKVIMFMRRKIRQKIRGLMLQDLEKERKFMKRSQKLKMFLDLVKERKCMKLKSKKKSNHKKKDLEKLQELLMIMNNKWKIKTHMFNCLEI